MNEWRKCHRNEKLATDMHLLSGGIQRSAKMLLIGCVTYNPPEPKSESYTYKTA